MVDNSLLAKIGYVRLATYILLLVAILITLAQAKKTIYNIELQSEAELALMDRDSAKNIEAIITKTNDPQKLTVLGLSLIKNSYHELAITATKKACELDPKWRDTQWALAISYGNWSNELTGLVNQNQEEEFNKRKALTKEAVEKTLAIDPVYQPARDFLSTLQ